MRSVSPVSLWHGTSTALLPLIFERGLGGTNMIEDLKAIEFIGEALKLVYPVTPDEDFDVHMFLWTAEKMAAQKSDHMNWRHGQVYITASRTQAAGYAMNAPEAIDTCRKLAAVLHQQGNGRKAHELFSAYPHLSAFMDEPSSPVVIELREVPCEALLSETESNGAAGFQLGTEPVAPSPCETLGSLQDRAVPLELSGQGHCFILNTVWQVAPESVYSVNQTGSGPQDYAFAAATFQHADGSIA